MKYKPRSFTTNVTDERLGAGSYFKVLKCPATATVSYKLGSTDVDAITLNENDSSDFAHQDSIYVSIENLLPGELVTVVHAEGDFSINNESSNTNIGSYNAAALLQLGKMFEPYELPTLTSYSTTSTVPIALFTKTLTCDKVRITLSAGRKPTLGENLMYVSLDGHIIASQFTNFVSANQVGNSFQFELENVRGRELFIVAQSANATHIIGCAVEEFVKKV